MSDWPQRLSRLSPAARRRLARRLAESSSRADPADAETRLVAFYTARPGAEPGSDDLRRALESQLPRGMVPRQYVRLEAIPRLPNGKVDRARLAAMAAATPTGAPDPGDQAPPASPLEPRLLEVWKKVLRREAVGVTEDFFALGGDSILAMQVVSRLKEDFPALTLAMVFQFPTIRELAGALTSAPPIRA